MKALKIIALAAAVLALAGWLFLRFGSAQTESALRELLTERTGLNAEIHGGISWRALWPTAVTLNELSASNADDTERWRLATLRLEVAPLSVLRAPRSPEHWHFKAIQITRLRGSRGNERSSTARYSIDEFWLRSLRPEQPAPFAATLAYRSGDRAPVALQLGGQLELVAAERKLRFAPAKISGDLAAGECEASITLRPVSATDAGEEALQYPVLSVDLWRRTDWQLDCALEHLTLAGERFADVSLKSNNLLGVSESELNLPTFLNGTGNLQMAVDAGANTDGPKPRWVLTPTVDKVAAEALVPWLQRLTAGSQGASSGEASPWQGPVSVAGRIETFGNERASMLNNARGELTLVSNNGVLDLTEVKARSSDATAELRGLLGNVDPTAEWPQRLEYLTLTGRWVPNGERQLLKARLDNLLLDTKADLKLSNSDSTKDQLRAVGTLTFSTDQPPNSLPVPALLEDLPLPLRCSGRPQDPDCRLDSKAARKLIADAMKGNGPGGLGEKIDQLIDENVPEEYRAAARGLLEILGHSVEDDESLDDFIDEALDEPQQEEPDSL